MASKYLDIIADIKTKMQSVTNIGLVHDYERYSIDIAAFVAIFKTTIGGADQIRGWEITRVAATEHKAGAFARHHQFKINGYMGLKDSSATDKTFQQLVDDVCEKFRNADPPPGATWDYRNGDKPEDSPAQAISIDVRMFGGVLCHCAEITLSVTERIIQ